MTEFRSVVWPDKRRDEHYPNCHRELHWWSFRCTCAELEAAVRRRLAAELGAMADAIGDRYFRDMAAPPEAE